MSEDKKEYNKPYIEFSTIADAGMVSIIGGNWGDLVYKINGGSPKESALNEAYKLALTLSVPLWSDGKRLI